MIKQYRDTLDAGQQTVSPVLSNFKSKFAVDWAPFLNSKWTDAADTMVVTFGEVVDGSRTGTMKRQYWVRQGPQWKIFFEGVIG